MIRLSRAQVRSIDELAVKQYAIPGIVLMENAARGAADVAHQMLGGAVHEGQIIILCGGGNNGGDGMAIARHLHNRGHQVALLFTKDPNKYSGDAETNWLIVQSMRLQCAMAEPAEIRQRRPPLIVDAIFGTGLTQPPRDPFGQFVAAVSALEAPILAIDLPSGLDCDNGIPLGPACVKATRTVTFVAEKIGFSNPDARKYLGEVVVADIGCPRELIEGVARATAGL